LRHSALVHFEVNGKLFILKIPVSGFDFQNTGLSPTTAKLAAKYRPGR